MTDLNYEHIIQTQIEYYLQYMFDRLEETAGENEKIWDEIYYQINKINLGEEWQAYFV